MDFSLTEDQRAIAEMAEGLFKDYCTDDRLRDFDIAGEPYMKELWQTCVETGLHALAIPEEFGGSGLGMTELFCVLKAQGAGLGSVPLWEHQITACALAEFAGEPNRSLLEQASEGSNLLTVSLAELNDKAVNLRLLGSAGERRLTGMAKAVPFGRCAERALVIAMSDHGPRAVLVDPSAEGVEVEVGTSNHGLEVADIRFSGMPLEEEAILPEAAIAWLEERGIAAVASTQLGVNEEQIRRTAEYLQEREQFGRAIGTFQAVQMTMADCQIAVEALRSSLYQLLYRLDAGLPSPSEALATNYLSAEAAHLVGHKTQHVHGGVGVDLTYPIHRFLYWSRHLSMVLGSSEAGLERLGDWLANNDKLGWKYDLDEHQIAH